MYEKYIHIHDIPLSPTHHALEKEFCKSNTIAYLQMFRVMRDNFYWTCDAFVQIFHMLVVCRLSFQILSSKLKCKCYMRWNWRLSIPFKQSCRPNLLSSILHMEWCLYLADSHLTATSVFMMSTKLDMQHSNIDI